MPNEPIAIIGVSCRVPGGENLDELLDTLMTGTNTWSEVPKDRFNGSAFYHPDSTRRGQYNSEGAHFIEGDLKKFDAPFFNLSVAEANAMDAQQKHILEVSYEALETAGMSLESITGQKMGVFVSYTNSGGMSLAEQDHQTSSMFMATANFQVMLSNRISHVFNLHGPSFTVDTACSSGLTALHLAVQDLRAGGCESAIVAGSHLITSPDDWLSLSNLGLHSNSGKSFAYDDRAQSGYGRGEGTIALILKPLGAALRDCNPIRALIRGTGINQNGKRSGGLTAPSIDAQEALIRDTYRKADMALSEVDFVEGHGTGTGVGDPVEIQALGRTFGSASPDKRVLIGSVKSNVGHLEGSSGLASVVKAVLMIEKEIFFPNADFETENKRQPPSKHNLKVCSQLQPWRTQNQKPRTVSINNSGFGGSNSHAILQQYVPDKDYALTEINGAQEETRLARFLREVKTKNIVSDLPNGDHSASWSEKTYIGNAISKKTEAVAILSHHRLFVLSARTQQSLEDGLQALDVYMRNAIYDPNFLNNLAHTLERRSLFSWRAVIVAATQREIFDALQNEIVVKGQAVEKPKMAFVFTGQGAAWPSMGYDVYQWSPDFRESIRKSEALLISMGAKWSLSDEMSKTSEDSQVMTTELSQTVTTCIQIALVDMLEAWNVRPGVVTGHSSGEIAASYAAGITSREDCIRLAYFRGTCSAQLSQGTSILQGGMLALGVGPEEAQAIIAQITDGLINIACMNSPNSVTLSGDIRAIKTARALADEAGIFARLLKVDVAYHSHHMKAVEKLYASKIGSIKPNEAASVPFVSSLYGRMVSPSELDQHYWVDNLLQPVNFTAGIEHMFSMPRHGELDPDWQPDTIVEIGPHPALRGPALQTIKIAGGKDNISYLASLKRNESGVEAVLDLASQLFVKGLSINIDKINDTAGHGVLPQVLFDVPTYSWMHNIDYCQTSRLADNRLFPKYPVHDLLGQLTSESTPLHMTWRNVLNVRSMVPWLADHQLQGDIVFPGAGYVSMAIEAKYRSCALESGFNAISLRDVSFTSALSLEESQDVELLTYLSPFEAEFGYSSDWDQFRIMSWTKNNGYTQHCQGLISGVLEEPPQLSVNSIKMDDYKNHDLACTSLIDFYSTKSAENVLKGVFRPVRDFRCNPPFARGEIQALDTASTMPYNTESDYIIHPTIFDACLQVAVTIPTVQGAGAVIPKSIKSLTLSLANRPVPSKKLVVNAIAESADNVFGDRLFRFQGLSEAGDDNTVSIVAEGVEFAVFEPKSDTDENLERLRSIACSKVVWEPVMSMLSTSQSKAKFSSFLYPGKTDENWLRDHDIAAYIVLKNAISSVSISQIPECAEHLRKFYQWTAKQCAGVEKGLDLRVDAQWSKASKEECSQLLESVRNTGDYGEFLCHIGEHVPKILTGEAELVTVMVDENRLSKMYEDHRPLKRLYQVAASLLDTVSHQNPNLRIIEVGGGTGGVTMPILEKLTDTSEAGYSRFKEYMFTDISAGFFEDAQAKFGPLGANVTYKVMDVEKNPSDQGFATGCYDFVVASNVLHATADIRQTLNNVKSLLAPGGVLMLLEVIDVPRPGFPFVMTPGWWLSKDGDSTGVAGEPFRCDGPTMTDNQWNEVLMQSGFPAGAEISIPDYDTPEQHQFSLITSRVPEKPSTQLSLDVVVAYHGFEDQKPLSALKSALHNLSKKSPKLIPFSSLTRDDLENSLCIVFDHSELGILYAPDEALFESLQALTAAKSILWISHGARSGKPTMHMVAGFANTLRNELTALQVVTLDLDISLSSLDEKTIGLITTIIEKSAFSKDTELSGEVEFREQGGVLHVPRLIPESAMSDLLREMPAELELLDPFALSKTQTIAFANTGNPDSFYFAEDSRGDEDIKPDEVEIEPKAFGLNFRSVLISLGQMTGNMGFDTGGVIRRVGANVKNLVPGDRIATVTDMSTRPRVNAACAVPIPDSMSYEVAASLMTAHCTAYYALIEAGNLKKGESILIHAGAGSLGQAAISVANMIGATVYTTVSTVEKADLLVKEYGVPRDNIFNSRTGAFKDDVMAATHGQGVDVVLNSLAGDLLRLSWECVAPFGRFLEVGKKDIFANSRIGMAQLLKNVTMRAVDLAQIYNERPKMFGRLLNTVIDLITNGKLKTTVPIEKFGLADLPNAFRLLGSGKTMGKLVVDVETRQKVMVQKSPPKDLVLREDASYLITGGTGGIGMSACRHLAKHGAKSIILLSRSGGNKDQTTKLIEDLAQMGTRVTIRKCDVGKRDEFERVIQELEKELSPIRGVIHGAMHIQDRLFEGMTNDFFMEQIRPKVHCAINLNDLLSDRLDFLVMLSSVGGLRGTQGQTPYAATSTFLDGYAHHLRERGVPASVIDIGVVSEIGYVTYQSEELQKRIMSSHSGFHLNEQNVIRLIDTAIQRKFGVDGKQVQCAAGIIVDTPADAEDSAYTTPKFDHLRKLYADMFQQDESAAAAQVKSGQKGISLRSRLAAARASSDPKIIAEVAMDGLMGKLSRVMMIPREDLLPQKQLKDYGFDSLVSVEVRNWLTKELEVNISMPVLLGFPSIAALAERIVETSPLCVKKADMV